MTQLAILQSGFITPITSDLSRPDPISNSKIVDAITSGRSLPSNSNDHFFSSSLEELYNNYRADNILIKNFDFQNNVINAVTTLFDNMDFNRWIKFQDSSEYFTATHKHFIEDTIKFILTGERKFSLRVWGRLVTQRQATVADRNIDISSSVNDLINLFMNKNYDNRGTVGGCLNHTLNSFIFARWISRDNGFVDFLTTMQIIFGRELGT